MAEKRKDKKGRILRENEMQKKDGLYVYSYTDVYGSRKQITSWKLVPTDKVPSGKRDCLSFINYNTKMNIYSKIKMYSFSNN